MKYRSEIDGLRALAVIPVILFHAGVQTFKGGFVGVDIFFVISGYLITTIIHDEIQNNKFSLISFYERRVRRILPALFLICLASYPFAWLWMVPSQFEDFSQSIFAVNVFSSNILFYRESGYFDPAVELKPLLHTWSLAVEEQFYVFFPLILLFFRKLTDRYLVVLIAIICLISLGLAEYLSAINPTANFYLLPTRAWELGVGAIVAITSASWRDVNAGVSQWMSSIGMAMIVYSILVFDENVPFPSLWALIPVLGSALIIIFARANNFTGKILGSKPFVGIGLISYSAYLWHQPLFAFARIKTASHAGADIYLMLSVATLVLAYFSWRYIETPFRNKKRFTRSKIFVLAVFGSIIFIFAGLVGHLNKGFDYRLSSEQKNILSFLKYDIKDIYKDGVCFLNPDQKFTDISESCFPKDSDNKSLFVWGDSHAAALSFGLRKEGNNIVQVTASLCPPLIGYDPSARPNCKAVNDGVTIKIKEIQPDLIIFHANWISARKALGETFVESVNQSFIKIKQLAPQSKIILVGGVPQWESPLPERMVRENARLGEGIYIYSDRYKEIKSLDAELKNIAAANGTTFISLLDEYCKDNECLATVRYGDEYEPFAWDSGHLTRSSSSLVAKHIYQVIGDIFQ